MCMIEPLQVSGRKTFTLALHKLAQLGCVGGVRGEGFGSVDSKIPVNKERRRTGQHF